jgi:O-methyltransferase involved in polyketide biosynthesis
MYLTRAAVKATLAAVWNMSGSGSVIAHDMWHVVDDPSPMGTARRLAPNALSFIGEPVTFCIHPEDMHPFLERHGFHITDLALSHDLQQRYAAGERAVVDESMYVLAAERLDSREGP